VRSASVARLFSAARQGLEVGLEYGAHSLEALLWIAETVEESVYRTGSLARTPEGVRFTLSNPPLRLGAFSAVRLAWNGAPVPSGSLRIRAGIQGTWRVASEVTSPAPIDLLPGIPIDIEVALPPRSVGSSALVRLELECRAIPPVVWLEFRDAVGGG
jgi:hypothetical protein